MVSFGMNFLEHEKLFGRKNILVFLCYYIVQLVKMRCRKKKRPYLIQDHLERYVYTSNRLVFHFIVVWLFHNFVIGIKFFKVLLQ